MDEERLEAAARNSAGEKEKQKDKVRLIWALFSAELRKVASGSATQGLYEKQKSGISGKRHRPNPIS